MKYFTTFNLINKNKVRWLLQNTAGKYLKYNNITIRYHIKRHIDD